MTLEQRLTALAEALGVDVKTLTDAVAGKATLVPMTQTAYDALTPKDPDVYYVITGP